MTIFMISDIIIHTSTYVNIS